MFCHDEDPCTKTAVCILCIAKICKAHGVRFAFRACLQELSPKEGLHLGKHTPLSSLCLNVLLGVAGLALANLLLTRKD